MKKRTKIDLAFCKSRPGINALFNVLKEGGYHKENKFFNRRERDGKALEEVGLVTVHRVDTVCVPYCGSKREAVCLLTDLGKEIVSNF